MNRRKEMKIDCKHKWDYIKFERLGENPILAENPLFALWICPYCNEQKWLKIENANRV